MPTMPTMPRIRARALLCVLLAAPALLAAQDPAEAENGRRLYEGMCVTCHGFAGAGGEAPSLSRPLAQDDDALRNIIGNGIPIRGMPRVRRFTDNEVNQLVAYVRSVGRVPAGNALVGNAERGGEIYRRQNCASCHVISGEGGSLGPELTSVGATRGAQHLKEAVVDPGTTLSRGSMPIPGRSYFEYLPVAVTSLDGREVRGMRINEDTFTIQLRDAANRFHTFRKSSLRRIDREVGKSLMPSFKDRLTGSEIDDLVAYLFSLRGAK